MFIVFGRGSKSINARVHGKYFNVIEMRTKERAAAVVHRFQFRHIERFALSRSRNRSFF